MPSIVRAKSYAPFGFGTILGALVACGSDGSAAVNTFPGGTAPKSSSPTQPGPGQAPSSSGGGIDSDAGPRAVEHADAGPTDAGPEYGPNGGLQAGSAWPMFKGGNHHRGRNFARSLPTAAVKWTRNIGTYSSSPVIAADGTVYVGGGSGAFALTPSGDLVWTWSGGGGGGFSSAAIGVDGTTYFTSDSGGSVALRPGDGQLRWSQYQAVASLTRNSPAIGASGVVYAGAGVRKFFAYRPDGTVAWSVTGTENFRASAAIGDDDTVFVGDASGMFYAIDARGGVRWQRDLGAQIDGSATVGNDGTLYVPAGNAVHALRPADGSKKWAFVTGAAVYSTPSIANDGTVYFGSTDGKFYALDPTDGHAKWTRLLGNSGFSSPAIAGDGTIYAGCADGSFYAIEPGDGRSRWRLALHGGVYSSPAIAADGTVYVVSGDFLPREDGEIAAIGPQ